MLQVIRIVKLTPAQQRRHLIVVGLGALVAVGALGLTGRLGPASWSELLRSATAGELGMRLVAAIGAVAFGISSTALLFDLELFVVTRAAYRWLLKTVRWGVGLLSFGGFLVGVVSLWKLGWLWICLGVIGGAFVVVVVVELVRQSKPPDFRKLADEDTDPGPD